MSNKTTFSGNIISVPIQSIKPYQKNAKKHTPDQITTIKQSIKDYDYIQPIAIDKNNEIVIGHGRYFALMDIDPDTNIEVIDLSYLKPKQIKKLRILDNKVVSDTWDQSALYNEIENIYGDIESQIEKIITETAVSLDDLQLPEDEEQKAEETDKNGFKKVSFTLSDRQVDFIQDAIDAHIGQHDPEDNDRAEENALEYIVIKAMRGVEG